jgi:hypothetical protein
VRLWSELSGWHRLEHWYRVSVHLRQQTCVRVKVLFVKVVLIGIFRVIAPAGVVHGSGIFTGSLRGEATHSWQELRGA